jgi:hypothetical protein
VDGKSEEVYTRGVCERRARRVASDDRRVHSKFYVDRIEVLVLCPLVVYNCVFCLLQRRACGTTDERHFATRPAFDASINR